MQGTVPGPASPHESTHPPGGHAADPLPGGPLEPDDPRHLDGYDVLARIGAGGMGTVYLGQDADGKYVAIKVVHSHLAADAEFRVRFAREARAGQRVPAFCSARVLHCGTIGRRPFLVTEYIDGIPLSQYVTGEGPMDLASLHALALGAAASIAAIHSVGLVHRDLKPSNVMLAVGGIRIIDFGIAKSLDETSSYTRTGIVMGSLGWAAPEQLQGAVPTPAMDVFAWGCLVAFAATARHPFGPGGLDTRANRILHEDADLEGVPDPLRDLVASALHRDPAARPTAQDLLIALVCAGPSTPRSTGSGSHPHLRPSRPPAASRPSRGRLTMAAAGSVPVLMAGALFLGITGATQLGDVGDPDHQHRPGNGQYSDPEVGATTPRRPPGAHLPARGQPTGPPERPGVAPSPTPSSEGQVGGAVPTQSSSSVPTPTKSKKSKSPKPATSPSQ